MTVTKEQIFEIADQLATDGQDPTLIAIRKALGDGSYTTISEAMSEWRAARQVATAPLREPVPPRGHRRSAGEARGGCVGDLDGRRDRAAQGLVRRARGGGSRRARGGRAALPEQLSITTERAATAEVRAGEIEARTNDLNKELERARADLRAERQSGAEDRQRLEAERDEARKEDQIKAIENSRLVGELQVLKTQVKKQIVIIKGMAGAGERKTTKKTA